MTTPEDKQRALQELGEALTDVGDHIVEAGRRLWRIAVNAPEKARDVAVEFASGVKDLLDEIPEDGNPPPSP